jgi:hypothetical protein
MNAKERQLLLQLLQGFEDVSPSTEKDSGSRFLKFNDKEILQMPKTFRKEFRAQGCTAHVRKRTDGRYNCSYEIRYTRNGYNISASATTLDEAKRRFIEKLTAAIAIGSEAAQKIPKKFGEFATYWFENFHKRKVCKETYAGNTRVYNKYIKESFGKYHIKDITPVMLQSLLDSLADRPRLAEDAYSICNQIFKSAINHGIITLNPINLCFHKTHEREHGKRIRKAEEIKLLNAYANTSLQIVFAVLLYTGLRPGEYSSAIIQGQFIVAKNSKRKNGKVEYKKIPISPMLRPYLIGINTLPQVNLKTLDKRFKVILPSHKLYDMRTTFQTRCTECGIPDTVIGVFMGNGIGKLKEAYTDFSDEYLIKEAQKLNY